MLFVINEKEDVTGSAGKLGSSNSGFSIVECGPTAEERKVPGPTCWEICPGTKNLKTNLIKWE